MIMKNNQKAIAIVLVLLAVVSRIIGAKTGAYNFAPVVAIGLLSGALIKDVKTALLVALLGQFLADVYFQIFPTPINIGFYGISQLFTYGGLIIAALLGVVMKKINVVNVILYTLGASVAFFIISNLGYFIQGWNGYTATGFVKTYVDAIPFFKNSLIGDMTGSAVLFGLYFAIRKAFTTRLYTA